MRLWDREKFCLKALKEGSFFERGKGEEKKRVRVEGWQEKG